MGDIAVELRAYAARRRGATPAITEPLVAHAARLYDATLRTLQRPGPGGRFWRSLEELSMAFDAIKDGFPGDLDYYLQPRQWEELVLPALRRVGTKGPFDLVGQLGLVGDLIIHTHCQALTREQQQAGVEELCRILGAAARDEPMRAIVWWGAVSSVNHLLRVWTERKPAPGAGPPAHAAEREADAGLAAQAARGGVLKAALRLLIDPKAYVRALGVPDMLAEFHGNSEMLHVMQAAASMALSLLATDDRDTLAGLGRWLAGGDRAQLLLRHLYYDELSHRFVPNCVHGVCLLGALCCASPPLLAVLRGDLQSSMAALRRNPECSPVDRDMIDEWTQRLFVQSPQPGGRAGADQPAAGAATAGALTDTREQLAALSVGELKSRLQAAGIDSSTCTEKQELVELLLGASDSTAGGSAASGSREQPSAPVKRCIVCGATKGPGVKIKLCAGCRDPAVAFCSVACQRQCWPQHKAACKAAQAAT